MSLDEGVTLFINLDDEGRALAAMPDTLFDEQVVEECLSQLQHAYSHMTTHVKSFVKANKVYNAPLKPNATVDDLEVNYSTFRPYKMLPTSHFVGTRIGFCRVVKCLLTMANSDQLDGRYMVVNVDENLYKRGVKVSIELGVKLPV